MRNLAQPKVLKLAGIAALVSTMASYPRLSLWLNRPGPMWYLEAVIFFCSMVLWGFVFAWHTPYTQRPVFTLRIEPRWFIAVTLIGIVATLISHLWLDPSLRSTVPEDYPADLKRWCAFVLFSMAFKQLFLLFAPFDWLMRLIKYRWAATILTVLFGIFVLVIRIRALPTPLPPLLLAALLAGRIVTGFLAVWFYLRGGVILIWWWTLLLEARLLFSLPGNP